MASAGARAFADPADPPGGPRPAGRRAVLAEIAAAAACTGALLYVLRHALFPPVTRTFGHDLIFWYPVWQFYAEGLSLGELRLWNPLSYGGIPLYPALLQLRAFDPISFLVIVVGNLLTPDLLARYNWEIFLRAWIPAMAAHVFLRRFAVEPATRVALTIAAFCSSFALVLLRVHGAGQGFLWAPFIGILLYRLVWLGDGRWRVFAALAIFLGLNWQSYFFAPHATFAALFVLGLLMCDPARARRVLAVPRLAPKLALAGLILAVMAVPLAVVVREGAEVVYLPRVFDTSRPTGKVGPIQYEPIPSSSVREVGLLMPHEFFASSGTPSTIWNFLQLVTPTGNWHREGGHGWGNPSEAFMYLGLSVYAAALFGLFAGRHPLKRAWVLVLAVFGLLMLGPLGGAQSFLSMVFPLVRLVRHTDIYTPYFQLALLFFFVIGADRLLAHLRGRDGTQEEAAGPPARPWLGRVGAAVVAAFIIYLLAFETPTALRVFSLGKAVTPAAVALGLIALWWLARRLPPARMFWLCLLGHLAAVPVLLAGPVLAGLHTPPAGGLAFTLGKLGLYWLIFLALPLALYGAGLRFDARRRGLVVGLLLALLAADLVFYLTYTDYLWNWPRPDRILGVGSDVRPPAFQPTRGLYPPETERTLVFGQVIRYPELLLRAPYLLTVPQVPVPDGSADTSPARVAANLDLLRGLRRWNSFYVPRRYLWLLHAEMPAPVKVRILALGEPVLRFVPGYTLVPDDDFARFFREMSPARGRCLLARVAALPAEPRDLAGIMVPRAASTGADESCAADASGEAPLTVLSYAPGALTFEATTAQPGFIVISEGFHPRWTARVDGQPAPLLRADYLAQAVPVPAGTHRVQVRFEPGVLLPALASFTLLGLGALLGVATAGVAALARRLGQTVEEKR